LFLILCCTKHQLSVVPLPLPLPLLPNPQDYMACKWPLSVPGAEQPGSEQLAAWVDEANEQSPGWATLLSVLERARGV
jgi:hypothetical protein